MEYDLDKTDAGAGCLRAAFGPPVSDGSLHSVVPRFFFSGAVVVRGGPGRLADLRIADAGTFRRRCTVGHLAPVAVRRVADDDASRLERELAERLDGVECRDGRAPNVPSMLGGAAAGSGAWRPIASNADTREATEDVDDRRRGGTRGGSSADASRPSAAARARRRPPTPSDGRNAMATDRRERRPRARRPAALFPGVVGHRRERRDRARAAIAAPAVDRKIGARHHPAGALLITNFGPAVVTTLSTWTPRRHGELPRLDGANVAVARTELLRRFRAADRGVGERRDRAAAARQRRRTRSAMAPGARAPSVFSNAAARARTETATGGEACPPWA